MDIKVLSLTHDEIVAIISDGMYGNNEMGIDYDSDDWETLDDSLKTASPCFEDKCADLLLAGKSITLADYNYDGELYGKKGFAKSNVNEDGDYLWGNCYNDEVAEYVINLDDLLEACSSEEGLPWAIQILREDDDFYTGYNLLQIAMFGEIIYG